MDVLILNADSAPLTLLPLSTIKWQKAIGALYSGALSVVAEYDDWDVHSPSITMRVPSVVMTRKYLHFQRKVAFTDTHVFLRDRYTCQYCHKVFPSGKLTYDHVLPAKYGGKTTWENIATACGPCNFRKGSNRKIVPNKMPRKPSYYELLAIRKEFPIAVPCKQWVDYLDWPQNNVFIGKNILQSALAA